MNKILFSMIAASLIFLAPAGMVYAIQGATCPAHGKECLARDGDYYSSWYEEVWTNKLVRGRAGQLEYVRMPGSRLKLQKCVELDHQTGNK